MRKFIKRAGVAVAALLTGALATVGVAYAFPSAFAGTVANVQRDMTETAPWSAPVGGGGWVNVPSTAIPVNLPGDRVIESTFGAESVCQQAGYCSLRVVAINGAGVVTEFSPVVGADFAFDSPAGGPKEQHSMHRVQRLEEGNYTIVVQAQIVGAGGASLFMLDDYTHFVDVILP